MKKVCTQSLIIGIGIGMILTASFNYLWDGNNSSPEIATNQIDAQRGIEESIEDMKKDLKAKKEIQVDSIEQTKNVENNDEEQEDEGNESEEKNSESKDVPSLRLIITSGMNTNSIADLLWREGLISETQEFIASAHEKNYTRRFISGRKVIPINSSIDEILEILITK